MKLIIFKRFPWLINIWEQVKRKKMPKNSFFDFKCVFLSFMIFGIFGHFSSGTAISQEPLQRFGPFFLHKLNTGNSYGIDHGIRTNFKILVPAEFLLTVHFLWILICSFLPESQPKMVKMVIPSSIPILLMVLTMCKKMGQIVGAVLETFRLPFFSEVSRKLEKIGKKQVFKKNKNF